MINPDTLHLRSNNNILTVYSILKRRLETEDLDANVRAIFILNFDLLELEKNRRGI